MNKLLLIIAVALSLGAGFYAGIKYQQSKTTATRNQRQFMSRGAYARPRVMGEIIAVDDKSITVKMTDGSSKIVLFSDKVSITKATTGSKEDFKNGTKIIAFGTDNSDGSLTASDIQIR